MSNKLLWEPSSERISNSNAIKFIELVKKNYNYEGKTFNDLWKWSVSHPKEFWNSVWDFSGIIGEKGARLSNEAKNFWEYRYFPDAKLNFAENFLQKK